MSDIPPEYLMNIEVFRQKQQAYMEASAPIIHAMVDLRAHFMTPAWLVEGGHWTPEGWVEGGRITPKEVWRSQRASALYEGYKLALAQLAAAYGMAPKEGTR